MDKTTYWSVQVSILKSSVITFFFLPTSIYTNVLSCLLLEDHFVVFLKIII